MFFVNSNFDGTNIAIPLFNYLDFSFKTGLEFDREKVTTIQLNSNVGILHDSYLGSTPQDEKNYLTFFQLGNYFNSEYSRSSVDSNFASYIFTENIIYTEY